MTFREKRVVAVLRLAVVMFSGLSFVPASLLADSVTISPSEGVALSPITVTVSGFIGSNGPAPVTIYGAVSGSCGGSRPCTFDANMGYFSGKQWIVAQALVDGVAVTVSNSFTVREASAQLNRACGTNGTKVIVTGSGFGRNQFVSVDGTPTPANSNGLFAFTLTINTGSSGPYKIVSTDGFRFVTNTFDVGTNSVCEPSAGQASGAGGGVTITRPGGQPEPLKPGDPIRVGDTITTGAGGSATMGFSDGSTLTMPPNSSYTVDGYAFNPSNGANDTSFFSQLQGAFFYTSGLLAKRNDDNVRAQTAYGTIGIRGTEFISRRDPCSTTQEVYLIHGQLAITPTNSATTNVINAPASIYYDATNVWTNTLTQSTYDALKAELTATNPVTLGSWLIQYFGCTNNNAAALPEADPDGDQQSNQNEFIAGTDPTNPASQLRLLATRGSTPGEIILNWNTVTGRGYSLWATPDLATPFTPLAGATNLPWTISAFTNAPAPGGPGKFFRLEVQKP